MDYNKTICLPKTDFPMRAGLPKREPEMLKRWPWTSTMSFSKRTRASPFSLHDGPPLLQRRSAWATPSIRP